MKRLTAEQAAIVGAYTGVLCGPFHELHGYIEKIMGRPVWTHEMADHELMEQVREAAKDDFIAICHAETKPRPEPKFHAPHCNVPGRTACNKFKRGGLLQPSDTVMIVPVLEDVTCKVCLKSVWNKLEPAEAEVDEGAEYDAAMDDERIKLRQGEV